MDKQQETNIVFPDPEHGSLNVQIYTSGSTSGLTTTDVPVTTHQETSRDTEFKVTPPTTAETTESSQVGAPATTNPTADKVNPSALPSIQFQSTKLQNTTISRQVTKQGKVPVNEVVMLPSAASQNHEELARKFPSLRQLSSEDDRNWGATYLSSLWFNPAGDALQGSLSRENTDWRQGLEVNGDLLRSMKPHYGKPINAVVTGEQALQLAYTHMGIGDLFHAAMWNSGFWVTFKPAPDTVWLNINRMLGADVTRISRDTYGLLHSTATSLTIATIIDAILPFVYGTSVNPGEMSVTDIPKYLKTPDEHDFIWGFICANYPNGFNIDRSCIADPSKCRHVIRETINPAELQLVDNTAIPEYCRGHMRSRSNGVMSLKSVKEYQERLDSSLGQVIRIGRDSETELYLRAPTSQEKRFMSETYAENIKRSVTESVTNDVPESQREELYRQHITATEMRMYQHWVKKIVFSGVTADNPDDIANILGVWTRDDEMRAQFFDEIAKFIDNSAISVIALTAVKCPNCGADHSSPEQRHRGKIDCIPLDIVQVFSHLAEYKTRVISARL